MEEGGVYSSLIEIGSGVESKKYRWYWCYLGEWGGQGVSITRVWLSSLPGLGFFSLKAWGVEALWHACRSGQVPPAAASEVVWKTTLSWTKIIHKVLWWLWSWRVTPVSGAAQGTRVTFSPSMGSLSPAVNSRPGTSSVFSLPARDI